MQLLHNIGCASTTDTAAVLVLLLLLLLLLIMLLILLLPAGCWLFTLLCKIVPCCNTFYDDAQNSALPLQLHLFLPHIT